MLRSYSETLSEIMGLRQDKKPAGRSSDLFSSTFSDARQSYRVFRKYNNDGTLPNVICLESFELDEFFANVATYYSNQIPLTANLHVLGNDLQRFFREAEPLVQLKEEAVGRNYLILLGAALGESVLASLSSVESTFTPSYSACKRSVSYVVARALMLYPELNAQIIFDRWSKLRDLTGLTVPSLAIQTVDSICKSAFGDFGRIGEHMIPKRLRIALKFYFKDSAGDDDIRDALFECYPGARDAIVEMEGSFDGRMTAFTKAVEAIQLAAVNFHVDDLAVGYLCNRIFPGSFSHAKILVRLLDLFPTALIWYGVFCAGASSFEKRDFGHGIVEKLSRDLVKPFSFSHRPECDISLDELEVLMRAPLRAEAIKPTQQKIAIVSLIPGVDIYSRFSTGDDDVNAVDKNKIVGGVSGTRDFEVAKLLESALALLHGASMGTVNAPPVKRARKK